MLKYASLFLHMDLVFGCLRPRELDGIGSAVVTQEKWAKISRIILNSNGHG